MTIKTRHQFITRVGIYKPMLRVETTLKVRVVQVYHFTAGATSCAFKHLFQANRPESLWIWNVHSVNQQGVPELISRHSWHPLKSSAPLHFCHYRMRRCSSCLHPDQHLVQSFEAWLQQAAYQRSLARSCTSSSLAHAPHPSLKVACTWGHPS